MFADDVATFSDTVIALQRQIDIINQFCTSTHMNLNLEKSKVVVFRNGEILKQTEQWYYKGKQMETVPFYKYLGLYITSTFSWTKTLETLSQQAMKSLFYIFRFQRLYGRLDPLDAFKMFDTTVKAVLCYGSQLWGYKYSDKVERVHIKFCKQYCNLARNTSEPFALGECGRLPLCTFYIPNCIKQRG